MALQCNPHGAFCKLHPTNLAAAHACHVRLSWSRTQNSGESRTQLRWHNGIASGRSRASGEVPVQSACKINICYCNAASHLNIASAAHGEAVQEPVSIAYQHVMLAICDSNPYLGDGSKQALSTAATLASRSSGKVTVLTVQRAEAPEEDQAKQSEAITWHLQQAGLTDFRQLTRAADNAPVIIGDTADQVQADVCIMSTDAVHSGGCDANLLCEFVPCPLLLLP